MADHVHTETKENSVTDAKPEAPPRPAAARPDAAPAAPPIVEANAEPHHAEPNGRNIIIAVVALVAIGAAVVYGFPYIARAFSTVSTDDAYVNGHVTFVAARIPGQVDRDGVLVDDNYRVKKGDVLVRLDSTPYQVIVDAKQAAYNVAVANVTVAEDDVRATIGKARAARFKLEHTMEDVRNQIALLQANVAKLARADADYKRALEQQKQQGVISQQDVDQYKEQYRVALQQVYQTRVGLGLPDKPEKGELGDVPPDLDQTFSTVRQAVAELLQTAAPLQIVPSSFDLTPKRLLEEFYNRDKKHNLDAIYKKLFDEAPEIAYAKAKLLEARADLDQAKLNLSYCTVYAEIDGVVTGRNVNPGNNVTAGQGLMAVRSLTEIWIDANFKETQLGDLRIGQPADLDVDMYGSHKTFKGHITGFTMGTGSTLALLPAENATGNFVKVVQRLPVRIELDKDSYDPKKAPLFIGLSVTPYVYFKQRPEGANAGEFLQKLATEAAQQKPPPVVGEPKTSGAQATKFPPNDTGAGAKPEKTE